MVRRDAARPSWPRDYVDDVRPVRKRTRCTCRYWTDGDTRRRGEVLGRVQAALPGGGFLVDTHGELPDYLPLVLEFAAVADPDDGPALLQEYRASLELIRLALAERDTPYAGVVAAVCATLPGPSPADRQPAMALAPQVRPRETVGLEPYDPRLLPLDARLGRS